MRHLPRLFALVWLSVVAALVGCAGSEAAPDIRTGAAIAKYRLADSSDWHRATGGVFRVTEVKGTHARLVQDNGRIVWVDFEQVAEYELAPWSATASKRGFLSHWKSEQWIATVALGLLLAFGAYSWLCARKTPLSKQADEHSGGTA